MKQLGYGQEYKYAHSYEGNFVKQQFLPDELKDKRIWQPQNNPAEQKHAERMIQLWGDKFKKWYFSGTDYADALFFRKREIRIIRAYNINMLLRKHG